MTVRAADEAPIRVPGTIADGIFDHARANPEHEICGFVSARGDEPSRLHPVPNIAPDPRDRYRMDPAALVRTLFEMESAGEALFAIYHSHPRGPCEPSAIDIAEATWPTALYLIVSLAIPGVIEMRGFRIRDGEATEVELLIGD